MSALSKAEALINKLGDSLGGKCKKRFDSIYLSTTPLDLTLFEDKMMEQKGVRTSMREPDRRDDQMMTIE
jgi:hypothetical protein